MKIIPILVLVLLAADGVNARGEEAGDVRALLTRLQNELAVLTARVASLEAKASGRPALQPPDGAVACGALMDHVRNRSQGLLEMTECRQTDGQLTTTDGVVGYVLSFEANLRSKAAGIWQFSPKYEMKLSFRFVPIPAKLTPQEEALLERNNPGIQLNPGTEVRLRGREHFVWKDQAWSIVRLESVGVEVR